jgi:hypothetical protein
MNIGFKNLHRHVTASCMAGLISIAGVPLIWIAPALAQAPGTAILSTVQASALTIPMVAGIQQAAGNISAIESVIASTVIAGIHSFPGGAASIVQAVSAAALQAGVSDSVIGTALGQAVAALAITSQAQAIALASAVGATLDIAGQTAFNAATIGVTVNGLSLATAVAEAGVSPVQTAATIGGTNAGGGFAGGSSGSGSGGNGACVPTASATRC